MDLTPDAKTLGTRYPPQDRLSRRSTSPQSVTPLGGQELGSQHGWIHQPCPFTTMNTQQPPAYPVSTYQLGLPDLTIQRLPVVQPTSYLRTPLDHPHHTFQEGRRTRAAARQLLDGFDPTIAADGRENRSPRAAVNTSERSGGSAPLGLSNQGYDDSSATAQHHASRSQRTRSPRVTVNPVETRRRRRRITQGSSHRGHADSRAASQRDADRSHPYERANTRRPLTRGTRREREPRIPRTHQVLVNESEMKRTNLISGIIGNGEGDGGEFLSLRDLRREGWVISSVTLQIDGLRVNRVRVVYYRSVHSWGERVETVFTAEGGAGEIREGDRWGGREI